MGEREARKPLLIFGNGLQGEVENFQEGIISEEGVEMSRIEFRPTEEFVRFYGLTDDDFTNINEKTFIVDYPSIYVEILAKGDPEHQCIIVLCDFLGRDTQLTKKHIELFNSNKLLQREVVSLKYVTAKLNYDLQLANKNTGEYTKNLLDDFIIPIVKKTRGNLTEQPQQAIEQ